MIYEEQNSKFIAIVLQVYPAITFKISISLCYAKSRTQSHMNYRVRQVCVRRVMGCIHSIHACLVMGCIHSIHACRVDVTVSVLSESAVVVRWLQSENDKEARVEKIRLNAPGRVKYEKEIRKGYTEDKTGTACIWVWRWGGKWKGFQTYNTWKGPKSF